ncbi:hypothetical protein [Vibrio breoganii]|uniref:hypothetical protein n=1 Tax=Vibrio breoganii TaxID=553239 RepID=UPI001055EB28|nr:hypothetical protein [Vibrio breoganii]
MPIVGNSAIIAIVFSVIYVVLANKVGRLLHIILHPNTLFYVGLVSLPFAYYMWLTIFNGEMDFTYLTQYKRLIFYFVGAAVVSITIASLVDFKRYQLVKLFRAVVVIQLVIMLTAFFVPAFRELIALTKPDTLVSVADRYGGVRGLSLSGPQFFGVAVILSFVLFLLVIEEYNNQNRTYVYMIYALMLLFFMSAGRIVLVAGLVFFLYVLFQTSIKSYLLILRLLMVTFIVALVIVGMYFFVLPNSIVERINTFTRFTFEFVYNYFESGQLETSSTNTLFSMYFPVSMKTFIFGDGRYSDYVSGYYMGTDSGYMRQMLASGFVSVLVFFSSSFYLLFYCAKEICAKNLAATKGVLISLGLMLSIFHYKGEVFGYFLNLNIILWMFYFNYRYKTIS